MAMSDTHSIAPLNQQSVSGWIGSELRWPVRIVLSGAATLLLVKTAQLLQLPVLPHVSDGDAGPIAFLVFLVGIGVVGFLGYLTRVSAGMLRDQTVPAERLALIKDLPLGLP